MESIKDNIREMRDLINKVTTSDLQGIATVKAMEILGEIDINNFTDRQKLCEAEDVILQFANKEMDINSAKRFLLEISEVKGGLKNGNETKTI